MTTNKDSQKTSSLTESETATERINYLRQKAEEGELGHGLLEEVSGGTSEIHTQDIFHTDSP